MRILLLTVILLSVMFLAESRKKNKKCHKLVTANVGLYAAVPFSERRTKALREIISASGADVICAQEFWYEEDMAIVLKGNKKTYRHHYSGIHDRIDRLNNDKKRRFKFDLDFSKKRGACSIPDTINVLFSLYPCAKRHGCHKAPGGIVGFGVCVITNCPRLLQRTPVAPDCVQCFFTNLASSIYDSIYYCHAFRDGRRYNAPGLMLLSKKKIKSAKYMSFFPDNKMMLQRGYIEAEIKDVGRIVCTHLSSRQIIYYEYDLDFQNYEKQQRKEIEILSAKFKNKRHILLGDMNTGPEVTVEGDPERTVAGEFPDNYQLLLQNGYSSTYLENDGRCTLCSSNPLGNGLHAVIDHIFFKGSGYEVENTKRIWDTTESPWSDHYAVEAKVCQ